MTPRDLYEEIISVIQKESPVEGAAASPEIKVRIGGLIKQFRESLALTPKEFAQQLGVASQTAYRWEKGDPVPRIHQARKLELLLKGDLKTGEDLVEIRGHHVGIRTWQYIMDCMADAKLVWVLKCNREFLAGWNGPSRRNIIDSLYNNKELTFYYFFSQRFDGEQLTEENGNSLNPALDSYKRFKKALNSLHPDITSRVHGYAISDPKDRVALGLTPTYPTWIVLEYQKEATARYGKEFDILVEVPVAVYEPPEMKLADEEYVVWLELPQRRADSLWERWQELFKKKSTEKEWDEYNVESLG